MSDIPRAKYQKLNSVLTLKISVEENNSTEI